MTTGSGQTKYMHARTYKAFTPTQKPASQHVQLTYRLAISHVTSASHTTKRAIVRRHQRRTLSVAVSTLTLPVQTVRMSTFPVQCKQRTRDRSIPCPGNRTRKRLRKKGGRNCGELSGRRRRRRRTTTRRREEKENQHQQWEGEVMNVRA